MKCWCGAASDVVDSRQSKDGVTRRRRCYNDHLFTTQETRVVYRDYKAIRPKIVRMLEKNMEVKHIALQCDVSEAHVRKIRHEERRKVSGIAD